MHLAFSTCQQKNFRRKKFLRVDIWLRKLRKISATYCVGCAASVEALHWTVPVFILSLFGRSGSSGGSDCLSLELWLLCVSCGYLFFCWGTGLSSCSFPWSATATKLESKEKDHVTICQCKMIALAKFVGIIIASWNQIFALCESLALDVEACG